MAASALRLSYVEWWQVVPTAALVSAAVTLGIRWWDRPRPRLVFDALSTDRSFLSPVEGHTELWVEVTNAGDGTAFDVSLIGHLCDVTTPLKRPDEIHGSRWAQRVPQLEAGRSMRIFIALKRDDMDSAELIVQYLHAPRKLTWLTVPRRTVTVRLNALPFSWPFPSSAEAGTPMPRRWRRWRRLERRTLRDMEAWQEETEDPAEPTE